MDPNPNLYFDPDLDLDPPLTEPASSRLLAGQLWLLLVALAQQVRVELVDVVELLATDVAPPRIAVTVAALVQEVQCLVGELDAAEVAGEYQLPVEQQIPILSGRGDRPVADGRRIETVAGIGCGRCGLSSSSGSATSTAAINSGRSIAGSVTEAIGQHCVVVVLQGCGISGNPVVGLGADTTL